MTAGGDGSGRDRARVGDTLPGEAGTPVAEGTEVAPGVVLDPETKQPMEAPAGAATPPSAPPEMLGLPAADDTPGLEQPDDLKGPVLCEIPVRP